MTLGSWLVLPFLLVSSTSVSALEEESTFGFIALPATDMQFDTVPDVPGLGYAVLSGDPDSAGVYVIRLRLSPGLTFPPHSHDQDRHVTVISGVWAFGTGYSGKCSSTIPMTAGAYVMHPKGAVHFDGACGEEPVEIQISGLGPVSTTWVEQIE